MLATPNVITCGIHCIVIKLLILPNTNIKPLQTYEKEHVMKSKTGYLSETDQKLMRELLKHGYIRIKTKRESNSAEFLKSQGLCVLMTETFVLNKMYAVNLSCVNSAKEQGWQEIDRSIFTAEGSPLHLQMIESLKDMPGYKIEFGRRGKIHLVPIESDTKNITPILTADPFDYTDPYRHK
jgi:hypothetical protein